MFAKEFRAMLAALSFLTRLPVGVTLAGEDVRRSGAYFPLVGAGIGWVTGSCARRAGAAPALAVQTLLTGALHLDALADSADALGSRDPTRALEIMRDSRIGSFGTAALCLDVMIKAAALEGCEDPVAVAARAGALSRAVPVLLSAALPYARSGGGTGQALQGSGQTARAAASVGLALVLSRDRDAALLALVLALLSGGFSQHKLGGVTGDTLGASIELTETAILLWSAR